MQKIEINFYFLTSLEVKEDMQDWVVAIERSSVEVNFYFRVFIDLEEVEENYKLKINIKRRGAIRIASYTSIFSLTYFNHRSLIFVIWACEKYISQATL